MTAPESLISKAPVKVHHLIILSLRGKDGCALGGRLFSFYTCSMSRWQFYFFTIFGLVAGLADQLIKGVLIQSSLINNRLALGLPVPFPPIVLLIILAGCIIIFGALGLTAFREREWLPAAAWAWLTFGTLGNFLDRLLVGGVVDYIPFLNWTKFNLSDVLIVAGVGLLLFSWRRGTRRLSSRT